VKSALDIHQELLGRGVAHEIVRLARPVLAADELPDVLELPPERCVVVRPYKADGRLILAMMRAGDLPEPTALLAAVGAARLQPARPDLVNRVTDYAASLVSPLLLPPQVPLLGDAAVGLSEVVYAPTGDSGTALGIPSRQLLIISGARVTDLRSPVPALLDALDQLLVDSRPTQGGRELSPSLRERG
jgi:prolyl-tRNA editing enzyme YbaK/EbsC (Cys-tRNA(Pro) deacylase)